MARRSRARAEKIFFLTTRGPDLGHAGANLLQANVEASRPFREILKEWRTITSQISTLVDLAEKQASKGALSLTSMEVSIGFSATGKLVFVEGTAEASVTLTFEDPNAPRRNP